MNYYKCGECGARLYTIGGIEIHMKNVHRMELTLKIKKILLGLEKEVDMGDDYNDGYDDGFSEGGEK